MGTKKQEQENQSQEPTSSQLSFMDQLIERLLVEYRWIFVILFLLPASFLFNIWDYYRTWLIFALNSAPSKHDQKVKAVQAQVRKWNATGRHTKMCTGRPGWQTISFRQPKYKSMYYKVNINLVDILKVDAQKKTVHVEPMVTMGQLTARLEPYGWTLPVLPELDDLTVGGLVMGTGVETSSHKHGLFQNICKSFEIILPNGEVVHCSKDNEQSDLFYSIPWSYGTLGFLTSVELDIIPANRFVKLEYIPVHSLDHAVKLFQEKAHLENGNQFVEGLMFNRDQGVIMVGNMVTSAEPDKVNCIGKWYKPWFFKHVESFLRTGNGIEYIPLRDYFHRHSRSIFWEIQEIIPFGNSPWFRYPLGWLSPPKISLLKLTQTKGIKKLYEANHMIQDMLVPLKNLKESLLVFDTETRIYPLWLCPFKLVNNPGMLHPTSAGGLSNDDYEMYVDIGAYGVPKNPSYDAEKTTRNLEGFVRSVNGYQMLYADTYMTRDEFRQMFDHSLYDETRKKYNCRSAFPEAYDKISRHARI